MTSIASPKPLLFGRVLLLWIAATALTGSARAALLHADGVLCSLGDAIVSANEDSPEGGCSSGSGADTILLGHNVQFAAADQIRSTHVGGAFAALPDVRSEVRIAGLGQRSLTSRAATQPCGPDVSFRLVNVTAGARLSLSSLVLYGFCVVHDDVARGGVILVEGTAGMRSALTVENSWISMPKLIGERAEGGAIAAAHADLVVTGTEIRSGRAEGGADGASGGALFLDASSLTALGTTFEDNRAVATAGGSATGGAIAGSSTGGACQIPLLESVILKSNVAVAGAAQGSFDGGAAQGGALSLSGCTIDRFRRLVVQGNQATGGAAAAGGGGHARGGGILLDDSSIAELTNSSIRGNTARGGAATSGVGGSSRGGGLAAFATEIGALTTASLTGNGAYAGDGVVSGQAGEALGGGASIDGEVELLQNVSISWNDASGGGNAGSYGMAQGRSAGGGLYANLTGASPVRLTHLSVVGNWTRRRLGDLHEAAGLFFTPESSATLDNNLFVDNGSYQDWQTIVRFDANGAPGIESAGYNYFVDDRGQGPFDHPEDVEGAITGVGDHYPYGFDCVAKLPDHECVEFPQLSEISNVVDRGNCAVSGASTDGRGYGRPYDLATPDDADGCDPGAFELVMGKVIIRLDTIPDAATDFDFSGDGGEFALDDDADPTLPREVIFDVVPDHYSFRQETETIEYDTAATCVDPTGDSYVWYYGFVNLYVSPGETVSCDFINRKATVVTLVQETLPPRDYYFEYRGDGLQYHRYLNAGGPYEGDDVHAWKTSPGVFTLTQELQGVAPLSAIACQDPSGGTTTNVGGRSATLDLAEGDSVRCTFTNTVPVGFFTIAPCRVKDTRLSYGPLEDGEYDSFDRWTLEDCGIPSTAQAIAMNITAVAPTASGSVLVQSSHLGGPLPPQVAFSAGKTRANNAVVAAPRYHYHRMNLSADLDAPGTVHVVIDVVGYFQ
jgi:hypothetical protein